MESLSEILHSPQVKTFAVYNGHIISDKKFGDLMDEYPDPSPLFNAIREISDKLIKGKYTQIYWHNDRTPAVEIDLNQDYPLIKYPDE